MKFSVKDLIKLLVSLGLAAGLLWLFFQYSGIRIDEIVDRFRQADYRFVLISAALAFVAHWSRSMRWRMLMEPVGYKPTAQNAVLAVMTGYFANTLVPRLGEVTRCGTLNRLEGVPVNVSFGTVVAERIIDVLMLLVLIGLTFLLEFNRLSTFFISLFTDKLGGTGQNSNTTMLLLLAGGLLGLVIVAWVLFSRYKDVLRQKPFYQKVEKFLIGLLEGLTSVRRLKNPGGFLFHTVLIWTLYYLMSYVLFFAVPETSGLGILAGLTILVVGAIGMTTPTPGGTGSFQILVGSVLVLYGLESKDGGLLATFIWAVQTMTVLLYGGIAFVIVLLKAGNNTVTRQEQPAAVGSK
ncbi:lysylphosphatidylglycerol synthase transmembrane domain-containing protein [Nibrella saemangeumensis]|uniref:Lysylphosphatidylglycerol synthase transmembrane domain-containing protein n=1 Tax=Nibrella saemangeumensis TaxID=1084526 RepID=A0ABP8MLS5_9BACT